MLIRTADKKVEIAQIVINRWGHCPKIIAIEIIDMRGLWGANRIARGDHED
jgi:hypothetical protein